MPTTGTATSHRPSEPDRDGPLLEVDDLAVEFRTRDGVVNAVNGVSYRLEALQDEAFAPGRRLALVPEPENESEKVTYIVNGLKDIALSEAVPMVSIVAADTFVPRDATTAPLAK